MPTKIKNPADFASALLGYLGDPNTKSNVTNISAWEAAEGGNWQNNAKYNPLNTTEQMPGSVNVGNGIQSYKSWSEGIQATAQTLQNTSGQGYSQILQDLSNSADWLNFSKAVKNSNWDGKSHYSGSSIFNSKSPTGKSPNSASYSVGSTTSTDAGNSANSISKAPGAHKLKGLAGILQALDSLYSPTETGPNWNPSTWLSFIPNDIRSTSVMIFVRATSSILALGVIIVGIQTMLKGSSSGGSAANVLEFVNASNITNQRLGQASARIESQAADREQRTSEGEANRQVRITTTRSNNTARARQNKANREAKQKLAETPKVTHIHYHKEDKPNAKK